MTKADRMMDLLRTRGLMGASASELAVAADCEPKHVISLLKRMIEDGRVDTVVGAGRHMVYRLAPGQHLDEAAPGLPPLASWIPSGLTGPTNDEIELQLRKAFKRGYDKALADMRAWASRAGQS